jgi:alkylation response protein AidB-like acyl-CoA dehydrogenase
MTTQQSAHAEHDIVTAAQALAPLIQEHRGTMETERRLPAPVVDALRTLGALRLAVPRVYGGLELDPMTQGRVV